MSNRLTSLALLTGAIALVPALGTAQTSGTPDTTTPSQTTPPSQTMPQATPAPGTGPAPQTPTPAQDVARGDESFLNNASQAGHYEIQGSELALRKSNSEAVKAFAQRMIDDHGKVAQELAELARSKGVEVPNEPSLMQKGKLKVLEMRDDGFDQAYAEGIGVEAHQDAVKLFEEAAQDAEDADIQAFASRTVAALREHLSMAEQLRDQFK